MTDAALASSFTYEQLHAAQRGEGGATVFVTLAGCRDSSLARVHAVNEAQQTMVISCPTADHWPKHTVDLKATTAVDTVTVITGRSGHGASSLTKR